MQLQLALAAALTLGITVIAAIIVITRYITQLQYSLKAERSLAIVRDAEQKYIDVKARYDLLLDEVKLAQSIGTQALYAKLEIDELLVTTAKTTRASAASIFIPLIEQPSAMVDHLIFLSIFPENAQSQALRKKPIPLASFAGRCFTSGEPSLITNAKATTGHYLAADKISGFNTQSTINIPLKDGERTIGVLQLLNTEKSSHFGENDIAVLQSKSGPLSTKVNEFLQLPESIKLLGIIPDKEAQYATIVYCDLTNSSMLLQEMPTSLVGNYLNEFLESICEVGLQHGATIENYAGDGVMLRFNVPRRLQNHPYRAIEAAWAMKTAFEKLKAEWVTVFAALEKLHLRIGAAYGQVHEVVLGHPQYQILTVIGQPAHTAAYLCEAADRSKSLILIDDNLFKQVEYHIFVHEVSERTMSKPSRFVEMVYEVEGLGGMISAVG